MIRALALAAALACPAVTQAQEGGLMAARLEACGGTVIALAAPEGAAEADLDRAAAVLNDRLGGGLLARYAAVEGQGITVRLPASSVDLEAFAGVLGRGELGFHRVAAPGTGQVLPFAEGPAGPEEIEIVPEPELTGADIAEAAPVYDHQGRPAVSFRFTPDGARRFGELTAELIGEPFAIVFDGTVLSAPRVQEPIMGGSGQISGGFTPEEASEMAMLIASGLLPIDLTIKSADELPGDPGADQSLCPQLQE